jgi:BirA family transcriptional regulator, biotin operon repressor / biotin---[acetyl-CoA-carboxylase] ligase
MLPLPSFTPNNILMLSEIDSTNSYAQLALHQGRLCHGDVVQALHQVAGKGQRSSTWYNEKGKDLLMSVILQPQINGAEHQFLLSMACSLALCDLLDEYCPDITIKWSNDIYCGTKKIAGMLIENSWRGELWQNCVIGIGLNVNSIGHRALGLNATSIHASANRLFDLEAIRNALLQNLQKRLAECHTAPSNLVLQYNNRLMGKHKKGNYLLDGELVVAITERVEANGKLVLSIEGMEKSFMYGEIKWVAPI